MSIGHLGTHFSEILIKLQNFSFTEINLKISSTKRCPFVQGRWVNGAEASLQIYCFCIIQECFETSFITNVYWAWIYITIVMFYCFLSFASIQTDESSYLCIYTTRIDIIHSPWNYHTIQTCVWPMWILKYNMYWNSIWYKIQLCKFEIAKMKTQSIILYEKPMMPSIQPSYLHHPIDRQ